MNCFCCTYIADTEDFGDVQEVELGDVAPSQPSKLVNDDGSLQRQRTAWTTMVGHDRISNEDLQKRLYTLIKCLINEVNCQMKKCVSIMAVTGITPKTLSKQK